MDAQILRSDDAHQALRRTTQLVNLHRDNLEARQVIRDICSSGDRGLRAILGTATRSDARSVPAANMVLSGLHRLGQKIGRPPDLRVDLPPQADDSQAARKKAERIRRIVADYDFLNEMELKVAQQGLWLPAYGFATWAVVDGVTFDGHPFPRAEARDPFSTYPGEWGNREQPEDCAWVWRWPLAQLKAWCDRHGRQDVWAKVSDRRKSSGGIVLEPSDYPVGGTTGPYGQTRSGTGVQVAEYRNADGTWLVLPDDDCCLAYWPNPISRPTFVVMRRHTIGDLLGHYDHGIGLQSALVKMNTLALIAMEDATFSETNIEGQVLSGKYRRGRFAVNHLERGSQVNVVKRDIPYQYFAEIGRMEQQFRTTVGYPVTDDAVSPAAQATGQGIDRLHQPIDLEVKQYYDITDRGHMHLDAIRLEWDETCYPSIRKPLVGQRDGQPYAEYYQPAKAIKGWHRTRRTHGAMAGLSESAKLVGLLQLKGAGIVDSDTVRENLEGLGDVTQISQRVKAEQAEQTLLQAMTAGQPLDPRVAMTLIEMMPEGPTKAAMRRFWTPEDPQMTPEQEAMLQPDVPPAGPAGPPPDAVTMLSRLTAAGPQGGVQTVSRA